MEYRRANEPFPYKRMVVIGTTGSGKSTLAEKLAGKLGLDYIELDALNWGPNWTPAGIEVLCARVEAATRSPGWVVAGNYSSTRHITWPRAEAIIWLDYPFWVIFRQLLFRTCRRAWSREELWGGNRERLATQLKLWSDGSLFHWFFKTYWRRKREHPELFAMREHAHLYVFHLRTPQDTRNWFAGL